jgi:FlaA1/EpsC-like NDP-sugar epimerase
MSRSHEWRVVGFLDDDEKKHGRLLHGVRVLGALDELPRFSQRLKLRHAIIAMPSVPVQGAPARGGDLQGRQRDRYDGTDAQ